MIGYGLRVLGVMVSHPAEAIDRIRGRFELATEESPGPGQLIATDPEWERHVHDALGQPWPCDETAKFISTWNELSESFDQVIPLGTGHDADAAFARALWCLVRHIKPSRVVETGVARGIGTRFMLEALDANGSGHLWSIDLPPVVSGWNAASGAAIPQRLRSRWTFVRGSSRRRLPALLQDLSEIDMFIHDSLHTEANMRFEFESAWPALRPSGVLVSDDVSCNRSFSDFVTTRGVRSIVAHEDGKHSAFGISFRDAVGLRARRDSPV